MYFKIDFWKYLKFQNSLEKLVYLEKKKRSQLFKIYEMNMHFPECYHVFEPKFTSMYTLFLTQRKKNYEGKICQCHMLQKLNICSLTLTIHELC